MVRLQDEVHQPRMRRIAVRQPQDLVAVRHVVATAVRDAAVHVGPVHLVLGKVRRLGDAVLPFLRVLLDRGVRPRRVPGARARFAEVLGVEEGRVAILRRARGRTGVVRGGIAGGEVGFLDSGWSGLHKDRRHGDGSGDGDRDGDRDGNRSRGDVVGRPGFSVRPPQG